MLLNFSVSNFASIDDELILNLTAHKRARKTGLILNGKYKTGILPLTALYGANESGKSNIITALGLMKDKVLGDTERRTIPFMFGTGEKTAEPTSFGVLLINDGIMYHYGFSIQGNEIITEWLLGYYSNYRPTMLFERYPEDGKTVFSFGQALRKQTKNGARFLSFITQDMQKEKLFITEAAARNIPAAASIVHWFRDTLLIIPAGASRRLLNPEFFMNEDKLAAVAGTLRDFAFDFDSLGFHKTAVSIDEFDSSQQEVFTAMRPGSIIPGIRANKYSAIGKSQEGELYRMHLAYNHQNINGDTIRMPIESASGGFKRLLEFLSDINLSSDKPSVTVIDEIESSLHPLLLEKLISEVLSHNISTGNGQLVFVTHDTNILNFPFIRYDEIQFTEKDGKWSTHLTGLAEYKDVIGMNIANGYLKGRFGAVPLVSFDLGKK